MYQKFGGDILCPLITAKKWSKKISDHEEVIGSILYGLTGFLTVRNTEIITNPRSRWKLSINPLINLYIK